MIVIKLQISIKLLYIFFTFFKSFALLNCAYYLIKVFIILVIRLFLVLIFSLVLFLFIVHKTNIKIKHLIYLLYNDLKSNLFKTPFKYVKICY